MKKQIIIFMCLVITNLCFANWNEATSSDRIKKIWMKDGEKSSKGNYIRGIKEVHIFKAPEENLNITIYDAAVITSGSQWWQNLGMAIEGPGQDKVIITPKIEGENEHISDDTREGTLRYVKTPQFRGRFNINIDFNLKPGREKEFKFTSYVMETRIDVKKPGTYIEGEIKIIHPLTATAPDLELGKILSNDSRGPGALIKEFDLKIKGVENTRIEIKWDSQEEIENENGDELPIGIQINRNGKTGDGKLSYDLDSQGVGNAKIKVSTGNRWPSKLKAGKYKGEVEIKIGYK